VEVIRYPQCMSLSNVVSGATPSHRELRCLAVSVGGYLLRWGSADFLFGRGKDCPGSEPWGFSKKKIGAEEDAHIIGL